MPVFAMPVLAGKLWADIWAPCFLEQKLIRMWGGALTLCKPLIHTEEAKPLWHWGRVSVFKNSLCGGRVYYALNSPKGQFWKKDQNYVYHLEKDKECLSFANKAVQFTQEVTSW